MNNQKYDITLCDIRTSNGTKAKIIPNGEYWKLVADKEKAELDAKKLELTLKRIIKRNDETCMVTGGYTVADGCARECYACVVECFGKNEEAMGSE
jgi:hypothetical protein